MDARRGSEITMICGTNNTGKTAIARQLVIKYNKKRDILEKKNKYPSNYNKLIVYDPQHAFQDLMREGDVNLDMADKEWEEKVLRYRASLVVLDDYKELMPNDRLSDGFLKLMSARARFGLDFNMITWSPKLIMPRLEIFINKYILLKVNSDDKEFADRIAGDKPTVIGIKNSLNREFMRYTDEEYKKLYPNFPFVFWDGARNKAMKVNFKNK